MLDCLAFMALAELQPSFTELPRGMARLETGHIAQQSVRDIRVFLKEQDGANFYWVESAHGPIPHYIDKVAKLSRSQEFCDIMDVQFTQTGTHTWELAGTMQGLPTQGLVDLTRSYFHNHVWVNVESLLRLEVFPLPNIRIEALNLASIRLCEASDCSEEEDLTHLKQ